MTGYQMSVNHDHSVVLDCGDYENNVTPFRIS